MDYKDKSALPFIESVYGEMTQTEKMMAAWFLKKNEPSDPSLKAMARLLSVSEATLVRFAKKCGFKGYREFMYQDQTNLAGEHVDERVTESTLTVLDTYQDLLKKSHSLIDEEQISRLAGMIVSAGRIYVGGVGSSGLAAREMAYRFMRVGFPIEAIDDVDMMRMTAVFRKETDLVIGLSLSGNRKEFLEFLQMASERHAKTVLITSGRHDNLRSFVDEVVLVPSLIHMNRGHLISPQFPFLVMTDVLYAACMQSDNHIRRSLHDRTVAVIDERNHEE